MTRPHTRVRSIAARLSWMNLLVTGVALLLAYFASFAYHLVDARQNAIDNLTSEARIIGANSVTTILYNDMALAQSTLATLSNSSDVTGAAIYTPDAKPFAEYLPDHSGYFNPPRLPSDANQASWRDGINVTVASRIMAQGKCVGVVYIQARLNNTRNEALRYATITGAVLLLCLCIALLVGNVFRRILSRPVIALADTARLVSRYRDYSLRFQPTQSYAELQSLTEAFNEMLSEIQQRDRALEQGRSDLELRVEERTAQLKAANRELESFSYTVAHDLRGPLEIITNICYLLQHPATGEPPQEGAAAEEVDVVQDTAPMLDRLVASVNGMSNIIDDLLNLSRATSAGLHRKQLDLSAMALTLLKDLTLSDPTRDVKTSVQLGCHVNADKGLIQIVLQNLLRNAWKFTSRTPHAEISFGCIGERDDAVYFVRDNGAGFDQRMAARLFKPFERLHADSEFSGTGIGLATVQRIIERHGGKIWADGEIGHGATFYFTLGYVEGYPLASNLNTRPT